MAIGQAKTLRWIKIHTLASVNWGARFSNGLICRPKYNI
jgi:hypothetical protein